MFFDCLFVLFFFLTHKQVYASKHFTGSSVRTKALINIFSLINVVVIISYLVYTIIISSIWHSIILLIIAFIFTAFLNKMTYRYLLNKLRRNGYDLSSDMTFAVYNRNCDIAATVYADIGLLLNNIILISFIVTKALN